MATTPVNNSPAGSGAGGAPVTGNTTAKVSVKVNLNLGNGNNAIHQLNGKIGNNSQNTPPTKGDNATHLAHDGHQDLPSPQNKGNNDNNGNNGNHYGQFKHGGNQGQPPKGNNTPPGQTPPIFENPNSNPKHNPKTQTQNLPTVNTPPFNPGTQNQTPTTKGQTVNTPPFNPGQPNQFPTTKGQTVNTPPIIQSPNQHPTNNPNPKHNQQYPHWNPPVIINTRTESPNTPNGIIRNLVADVLRLNDIYLSRSVINNLVGNENSHGNSHSSNIPVEIRQLVQSVTNQLTNTVNNTNTASRQFIRQAATEISNNLQPQLSSARSVLIYAAQPDAKHFSNLNIQERVFLAVDLMFNHLPSDTNLNQFSNREIYNGFMLARGLVASNENTADIRNLVAFRSDVLPNNFSITGLRDLGQLVKVLVTDAANAKTTANLDLAVQKFIRILVANNELGVLLAAAALSKQAETGTLSMNRTLALVQIYQLVGRLVLAGEMAMKEAAAKNGLNVNDSKVIDSTGKSLGKLGNSEEKNALLRDLQTNNLHSNLKNFLEFNPAFVTERSISSFVNPDDARHAQQHFSSHHTDEIQQWLDSGNHRFVKEIDLDKPIGIVIERGTEDFFSASKARIVLVRDSSEQGWHFLKSFLVK